MPRYRIPYNAEALFVGPSPESGFHFLSRSGIVTQQPNGNINLISHINRVQNFAFDVNTQPTDVVGFGHHGVIRSYKTEHPTVSFSFDYIQMGVRNEDKIGLYVNFPYPDGTPIFRDNYQVFLLSGLYTSSLEKSNRGYGWPLAYRDCKNFFLTVAKEPIVDFNSKISGSSPTSCDVFGFGNCYLTNYSSRASVGSFPVASCSYEAGNLLFYSSGSGITNPSLNYANYTQFNNWCVIPNNYESGYVSALLPGDINVSITAYPIQPQVSTLQGTGQDTSSNPHLFNWGINYTGIQLQSYSLSMDIPRRPVRSLLYKIPINKKVLFPIRARLDLNAIVHGYISGSIAELFKNEEEYDISISIRNPSYSTTGGVAIRYDFKKLKLESYNYNTSIGDNKVFSVSLSTDLSPSNLDKGLFISGLYNTSEITRETNYLLQENSFRILQEDGSCILINDDTFFD